jgi:3-dehydroquinate synthase
MAKAMHEMEKIELQGLYGRSTVVIGEKISRVGDYLPNSNVFIVTDANVKAFHSKDFPDYPTYSIAPGESSKSLEAAGELYRWLLEVGADRHSFVLGIGGGVVCDLAGFVASTFMRGMGFGFVATSLLAQVDASVGGKNGVNLQGYKNIVGTFSQPTFVICDIDMLSTLPQEEYLNGFAEIVKHTLIADDQMFKFIEDNSGELKTFNPKVLERLVCQSVRIKASVVQADEFEKGERKKLNLGHTWGHAVEKVTGLSHGKSVSIGMEFAARFSVSKGLLENRDYMKIMNLLRELDLPICINENPMRIYEALTKDKKKANEFIDFILLKGIGNVTIERLPLDEIRDFIELK